MVGVLLLESGAVPLNYQFTSGALTGGFTADFEILEGGVFKAWKITAPTGFGTMAYDLTNPEQGVFHNEHFQCQCLSVYTGTQPTLNNLFTLGYHQVALPNYLTGSYSFHHNINDLTITGSGNFAVPAPNTLWSFALGLLALVVVQWLSPIGGNLRSSS
jgi:hypothetical protein